MLSTARLAETAALIGDPTRAAMLTALMDGRALTVTELARVANVTPQTASAHLSRMAASGLLAVARQGRHRFHRLASPSVAHMLEGIMTVSALPDTLLPRRIVTGPRQIALRQARTCYDHLAGTLAVAIADRVVARFHVELGDDGGRVTDEGAIFLRTALSIELPTDTRRGAIFCRPCLDWSERRPHIAGKVGAALCSACLERGWLRRVKDSRAVTLSPAGRLELELAFGARLLG